MSLVNTTWKQVYCNASKSTTMKAFSEACNIHYFSWLADNSRPTAEEANVSIEKYFAFIYPETESAIGLHDGFRFILEQWRMKCSRLSPPLIAVNKRQPQRVVIDSFGALT